jgi:DNA repair exonuclease SbcCD ATPase subunit
MANMDNTNMSLNEIATIRDILVGKEMRNQESELQAFKVKMNEELAAIQTAIDQLNQKIEGVRQQTEEHFDQLKKQIQHQQEQTQQQMSDQQQQRRQEVADSFAQLSSIFGQLSANLVDTTEETAQT